MLADSGDRVGALEAVEVVAGLFLARDHPDRALRLLAATERFHDDTGLVRFPVQAEGAERHAAGACAQPDPDDAETCWAEGTQLSLDEAVAYARRGRGQCARPQVGWAALTPTEREVVRPSPPTPRSSDRSMRRCWSSWASGPGCPHGSPIRRSMSPSTSPTRTSANYLRSDTLPRWSHPSPSPRN